MSLPVIAIEPVTSMNHMAEVESRLSEEERRLLSEIRAQKESVLDKIKELQRQIADIDSELEFLNEVNEKEDRRDKEIEKRKKALIKAFNDKPSDGIKQWVAEGYISDTPEDIAKLLFTEKLHKRSIGDYLGEGKEANIATLKAFIRLHEFTGKSLVDALRVFLWSFHLPGEAQKIDRIMELFASYFCECNPEMFKNSDTCYVLAYSVIMLNTSLHNPSVKDKPTLDRFILMNRGINDGENLPREILEELYESIKKEAFKVPDKDQLDETFFNPEREGWLTKEGGKVKNKRHRWFILKDCVLYYFKNDTAQDEDLIGNIPLENLKVREIPEKSSDKLHAFEVYSETGIIKAWKKDSENKVVKGNHSRYLLMASSKEEREEWIKCIVKSIDDAVYNGFRQRRRRVANEIPGVYTRGFA